MLQKVKGLVLRSLKYSETSLIFDLYTAEMGVQSFIVSGVRKKKAKMPAGFFQITSFLEVVAYIKQNSSLSRVKEVRPLVHYEKVPFDPIRRSIAQFMAEVVQKSLKDHESNAELYHFLESSFVILDQTEWNPVNHHLLFMLKLSRYLGFHPHGTWSESKCCFHLLQGVFIENDADEHTLGKAASFALSSCIDVEYEDRTHKLNNEDRREVLDNLILYFRHHLEHFGEVKTHQILAEVLS